MWPNFDEDLPEASYLVQAYSISTDEINAMIDQNILNGTSAFELSCTWILNNKQKWENWIVVGKNSKFTKFTITRTHGELFLLQFHIRQSVLKFK